MKIWISMYFTTTGSEFLDFGTKDQEGIVTQ